MLPLRTACWVSAMASGSAHAPVPGISADGSTPASSSASSRVCFSARDSEFASELVPNMASPTDCSRSQRQCFT
ncbi:hypothetical protein D9M71_829170 [compost metagenome]